MTDRYKAPDNASVFNLKRVHNGLAEDLTEQRFRNQIFNASLRHTRGQQVWAWESNLNLNVPAYKNDAEGVVTYVFQPGEFIRQKASISILGGIQTAVMDMTSDGDLSVVFYGGPEDIGEEDGSNDSTASIIANGEGPFVLRGKTRTSADSTSARFNAPIYIKFQNDTSSAITVTFKFVSVVPGAIAIMGHHNFDKFLKWNDNTGAEYWEVTLDDGVTWARLWEEGQDFTDRVGFIVNEQTVDLVHQDNILAGAGIEIDYGVLGDGTTPTVIITNTGGGGGAGTGDWTREDVTYQSLLEHSDFKYSTYDALLASGTAGGTAGYTGVADDWGAGSMFGNAGDTIITQNLILDSDSSAFQMFYFHAEYSGGSGYTLEYAVGTDATTFGAWVPCAVEEPIQVPGAGYSYLRFQMTLTGAGTITVYSFGVLYGDDSVSGGSKIAFLEHLTIDATTSYPPSTVLEIPNSKWYHKDGISLNVFLNRAKLIEGVDYLEEDVGFDEKSNKVRFINAIASLDEIVYQEYYGHIDVAADNGIRLDVDHYPSGNHKNNVSVYYVDGAGGNNANDGLTWGTAFATLDFALGRLDGVGGTTLFLKDDQSFDILGTYSINSTALNITRSGDGASKPVVTFVSSYDGSENYWGGMYLHNGTLRYTGLDLVIDDPNQVAEPDHANFKGIVHKNGHSNGTVHVSDSDILVKGASIYEGGFWGQVIDIAFNDNVTITGQRTNRPTIPLFDFNETLGGLYADAGGSPTLAGDATSWRDEVHGLVETVGGPANIRTNFPDLLVYADEITGEFYKVTILNGQIVLTPA